ncbi:DUF5658 family protein [Anaerobacillus sp. CMMVII]|uniref:DUF5658 family protein n=1 Tax=Anaerobacillus sp. CMMVII TaxID=2755588 RepID=UPI0037BEE9A0
MAYFFILAILNLLDGLFTFWGLSNSWITEVNPFMNWMWIKSPLLFLGFKMFLSVSLTGLAFYFYRLSYQKLWRCVVMVLNIAYSVILLLHINWIIYIEIT